MARSALLNVMVQAALKAGKSLSRDFGEVQNLQVSVKGPGDFVSQADFRAEKIVREELLKARPTYGFLGEEGEEIKGTDGAHRWIVDPLDGTTNFLHGIPQFAVSIALERNRDRKLRDAMQEVGRAVQRINDPAVRAVGALDLLAFLAEEAIGRTGLEKFLAHDLLGAKVGLRDEVTGAFHGNLQVLHFTEIARERLAGLECCLNHDIEKG